MPSPQLADYIQQVEAIKADAQTFVPDLPAASFNWSPGPGRWSIGQCLDHLNVCVRRTFPAFDKGIDDARARGWLSRGEAPVRYSWLARWMIADTEPPPKRRYRTQKIFVPAVESSELQVARVLPEFLAVRQGLIDRLRRADGLDLKRGRVISPASRFFRMSLGAYFAFVIAHDRRHLWQARQVLAALPPS